MSILRAAEAQSVMPSLCCPPARKILSEELDKKYANKILPEIGLCICTFDFKKVRRVGTAWTRLYRMTQ